jgi:hypothetical protein
MHKDGNLRKRNALVIPGGLLALYGFLGMAYVALVRGDTGTCDDAALVVFAGACRSAYILLAIPLVLGLALVATGAMAFRNLSSCRAGHGSWTHFGVAALVSFVVVPLVALFIAPSVLGANATLPFGGGTIRVSSVLAGLAGVGLVMSVPFILLYAAQGRANPCCQEKGCFDPCFCDEPVVDASFAEPAEAESPTMMAPPPAEPAMPAAAPATTEWTALPDEEPATPAAAEQWEVVPDEPAEKSEPAPEPSRRARGRDAPALALRPTDPAAPPADGMAAAAKWAEEDEEALRDLQANGSAAPGRRGSSSRGGRLSKNKKVVAKPKATAKATTKSTAKSAKKSKR